jgi:RNA polymerase sigma-70 factor (ECF subfamily)
VTQAFFAFLFERDDFASLDPARGSFRSWLRTCAKNFLFNHLKSRRTQRAGGAWIHVSIEVPEGDEHRGALTSDAPTPDRQFDRSWALTVTERAMANVAAQYEREGRAELFRALRGTLAGDERSVRDAETALATGRTVGAIKTERSRQKSELTERYRSALRAEVSATVDGPHAVDAELQELLDALSL